MTYLPMVFQWEGILLHVPCPRQGNHVAASGHWRDQNESHGHQIPI